MKLTHVWFELAGVSVGNVGIVGRRNEKGKGRVENDEASQHTKEGIETVDRKTSLCGSERRSEEGDTDGDR